VEGAGLAFTAVTCLFRGSADGVDEYGIVGVRDLHDLEVRYGGTLCGMRDCIERLSGF